MAAFTMTSGIRRKRKKEPFMSNALGGSDDPGGKYIGIREWRGEDLISMLFRTSIRMQTAFDRCFAQAGMTAQEASVLVRCVEAREISAGRLAQAMGRDKGKITRFVDRLEVGNFVTRVGDPRDHRLLIVKATNSARRIAPRLKMIFEEVREQLLEGILTEDIDRIASVLGKLYENAGRLNEEKPPGVR